MKKDTKTLITVVSVTAAVSFVVERLLDRLLPRVSGRLFEEAKDVKKCLESATVAEIQNELKKRQTEGNELMRG